MAIYIKGVEMPKDCDLCPFQKYSGYEIQPFWYCLFTGLKIDHSLVPSGNNCPLVYIPEPHGRLIDADVLFEDLKEILPWSFETEKERRLYDQIDTFKLLIEEVPTVIEGSE